MDESLTEIQLVPIECAESLPGGHMHEKTSDISGMELIFVSGVRTLQDTLAVVNAKVKGSRFWVATPGPGSMIMAWIKGFWGVVPAESKT